MRQRNQRWLRLPLRSMQTGWLVLLCCTHPAGLPGAEPPPSSPVVTNRLSLKEVLQRVLDHNESIQIRVLGVEINRKKFEAERGIFEPQIFGSVEAQENKRENNVQQQLATFTSLFSEHNNLYNGGLEFLAQSGAQLRIGYTLRDLANNLQRNRSVGNEYETFAGLSVVQPLLKNFGTAATLAKIRLAATESDLAYQEYRRQLMLVIARTVAAYWDLYLTQEQYRISQESVAVAESILKDNRARVEVGKSSDLEVLEAQAGVALRTTRQSEAYQKKIDAINRLTTLYSESAIETNVLIVAIDQPEANEVPFSLFESFQQAFELNPDYLSRRKQVVQENIKLAYVRNQRWPQLDLKASYGLNGLGDSPDSSWHQMERAGFPSWAVGLELRIPLTGGVRERNQVEAARLSQQQALISLKEIELQIVNAVDLALRKAKSTRGNVLSYQAVADFNQKLLETQLARLAVGKTDSRIVLETEEKLSEAKISVIDSLVQYQKALLEFELAKGATLQTRELELTQRQLEAKTSTWLQTARLSERLPATFFKRIAAEYDRQVMSPAAREEALRALREKLGELERAPTPKAVSPEQEKALQMLRQKMEELERETPRKH